MKPLIITFLTCLLVCCVITVYSKGTHSAWCDDFFAFRCNGGGGGGGGGRLPKCPLSVLFLSVKLFLL